MEKRAKVLVGAPIYDKMSYCFSEFLEAVKKIDYEDYDILLVENSEKEDFFNEIKEKTKVIRLDSDEKDKPKKVAASKNKIIDYALENNYDYILMLDSDVIPLPEIIKDLLKCEKDIVSGLCYNYFNIGGNVKWVPVCWRLLTDKEFEDIKSQIKLPPSIKSKEDVPRHLTETEVETGELLDVFHPTAGCMLISKKVFEKSRFEVKHDENGKRISNDDISFVKTARDLGFQPYCLTRLKCKHLVEGKFEKDDKGNLVNPMYK